MSSLLEQGREFVLAPNKNFVQSYTILPTGTGMLPVVCSIRQSHFGRVFFVRVYRLKVFKEISQTGSLVLLAIIKAAFIESYFAGRSATSFLATQTKGPPRNN